MEWLAQLLVEYFFCVQIVYDCRKYVLEVNKLFERLSVINSSLF